MTTGSPLNFLTGERKPTKVDTSEPIRPEWLRDRSTFDIAARQFVHRNAYLGRQWAANLPAIVGLLVLYSPRGLGRIVGHLSRYLYDFDSAKVRAQHAANTETGDYVRAQNVRKANLKARWMVAGTVAVFLAGPVLAWTFPRVLAVIVGLALAVWIIKLIPGRGLGEIVVAVAVGAASAIWLPSLLALAPRPPAWTLWAGLAVVVLALGWLGRPQGKALVKATTLKAGMVEPLKAPVVVAALCALGNSKMNEKTEADAKTAIRLLTDPHRHGPGVQVDMELPPGVPATFVQSRREEFAAALRRELGTVWPSVGTRHPGHLALFVSDQPMALQAQERWPLLKGDGIDLFRPFPAFTDQRGEWTPLTLAYANVIIGAVPRMGKTFVLRELLLAAGMDPRAKVYAFDGKGTGDLAPCALYAHGYVRGVRVDQPDRIEKVRGIIRDLRKEVGRRADVIDSLSREEAPESKVTSELVNARKDLDLGPIVLGIDETQAFFGYGDDGNKEHKAIRAELKSGITELVKLGPALGVIVLLATQQVNDATIPTSIANNAVIRFCLKIEGHEPNDRILGTGAYRRGLDAQMFDLDDKGIGYLKADGQVATIVRSVWGLDAVASEKLALRARQLRQAGGWLTGEALGEDMVHEAEQVDFLEDCRQVVTSPTVHLGDLAASLETLRPALYGHLDNGRLAGMLRAAGVQVDTVWDGSKPREEAAQKGVKVEWLQVTATEVIGDATDDVLVLTRPSDADQPDSTPVSNGNGHSPA